jgi:bifunctional DNase/RNase
MPVSRPLTHDLLKAIIGALGGKLQAVVINELADETFYAKLVIDANGQHMEIDSRPSDAIAVAIRAKVPIYVEDAVLDQAGMLLESEGEEGETAEVAEGSKEEAKIPSVFEEFLQTLDIDDLGKGGQEKKG